MDGEFRIFVKVWISAITCLCYCYYIASKIPRGILRLLSLLPIFSLFVILPFHLTSIHLGGPTAFFLVWLATFKLLLFSFDQPPLSPPPPNVLHFISVACLPIKLRQLHSSKMKTESSITRNVQSLDFWAKSALLVVKGVLLVTIIHTYKYRQYMHPYTLIFLYCLHLYLELEIVLAICATPARALFGFELEPQFNEPYFATSLQDFWGRRWNLMVTSILRPTVYNPIRRISNLIIGSRWAALPAVVAVFIVSGLMHEIVYYYLTHANPTWEVTWFFILHGICVAIEVVVKKVVADRWRLHRLISGPLTIVFVAVTGMWLFFPQLINNGVDERIIKECFAWVNFGEKKLSNFFPLRMQ